MNSTEFKSRFFTPYVGTKYEDGINGKKLLIIGASFNCGNSSDCGNNWCEF